MQLEIKAVDREFYVSRLRDWLPERIFDIHTHLWRQPRGAALPRPTDRGVAWPSRVASENPAEHLLATYHLLFPGKQVTPLVFATSSGVDLARANNYVARQARRHGFPALIYSHPEWSAHQLEERIAAQDFLGAKSYLSLAKAYLPGQEIRIYDFFPPTQLEVLNRRSGILMLHIPRSGRLGDAVNLAQLLEIEERYPSLQVIVAHVGRAYCLEHLAQSFKVLAKTKRLCFDISANSNAEVFRRLIAAVGPQRILFGSDLPISRMRTRRICEGGNYVNLVPRGLYGPVLGDKHLRAVSGVVARQLTFFLYEELDAFRQAALDLKLSSVDIGDVFYNNASRLLAKAAAKPTQQLRMVYLPRQRQKAWRRPALPRGYQLRTYRAGDEAQYIQLMRRAGYSGWNRQNIKALLPRALPQGIFFVVQRSSASLVASACAIHSPLEDLAFAGELGWLACDPRHRGRGLGAIVCAAVVKRLRDAGYTNIHLLTDDDRLPAIKIYLQQGWQPCLGTSAMAARWKAVRQQLNISQSS